jgi:hypothetical protein
LGDSQRNADNLTNSHALPGDGDIQIQDLDHPNIDSGETPEQPIFNQNYPQPPQEPNEMMDERDSFAQYSEAY